MTFSATDFSLSTHSHRTKIVNAKGVPYPVTGAGSVPLSPSLSLANTLLVSSLSSKLISVRRITDELNCVVLMYPTICLFQDILAKKIIGRGTRKRGCTMLMTLLSDKFTIFMAEVPRMRGNFGYGTSVWGIHHSAT